MNLGPLKIHTRKRDWNYNDSRVSVNILFENRINDKTYRVVELVGISRNVNIKEGFTYKTFLFFENMLKEELKNKLRGIK